MALSKDDLRIGNTVYRLVITNNGLRRKKLSMVDSEGNEWYRYDRALWTFEVTPMTICGVIKQVVRGMVVSDNISGDLYHVHPVNFLPEDDIDFFEESQLIDDGTLLPLQFFPFIDDAIAVGETLCNERNT